VGHSVAVGGDKAGRIRAEKRLDIEVGTRRGKSSVANHPCVTGDHRGRVIYQDTEKAGIQGQELVKRTNASDKKQKKKEEDFLKQGWGGGGGGGWTKVIRQGKGD